MKKESFTSAGAFPFKLLKSPIIVENNIIPYHVQINLTNICNLRCSFCSCANRHKTEEMSFSVFKDICIVLNQLGTKAVTITGGGEPLLYSKISEAISFLGSCNIKIGLVTNGIKLSNLQRDSYDRITWIRISFSDERKLDSDFVFSLEKAVEYGKNIDWAFSYVLTKNMNLENIKWVVSFANKHKFTHVRIVSDILDNSISQVSEIPKVLSAYGIDTSLVIVQDRSQYSAGAKKCLISLLKPVIDVDGCVYPCCGTQYALSDSSLSFPSSMCMGKYTDLKSIIQNQKYFNGTVCKKCYYENYNVVLSALQSDVQHGEFV